jgi:predicted kinase
MTRERQKPTLVLMAGLPGAGKTTLALALGDALRWLVLDKDMYKSLFATMGMIDALASAMAYELLFDVAQDILMRQNMSAIFDSSALHPFVLDHALAMTRRADAQLKVILCSVDYEERSSRLSRRAVAPSLPYSEVRTTEDERRLFSHLPAHTLTLQTTRPVEECVASALSYINQ